MKLDTKIVFSKGVAFVLAGFFAPWVAALGQWVGESVWPPLIVWVGVILPLSIGGATGAWLAFCSGTWEKYAQQMKADETGQDQVITTKPTVKTGQTEFLAKEKVKLP